MLIAEECDKLDSNNEIVSVFEELQLHIYLAGIMHTGSLGSCSSPPYLCSFHRIYLEKGSIKYRT